jgi:predicted dehydrogenase
MSRIDEGLIGEPRSVRAGFGLPFPKTGSRWSAELGGSTVLDQGIYPVTLAHLALGPVRAVEALGVVKDGVDIAAHITLEQDEGRFSHLACSAVEFVDPSASISGTSGWTVIPAMFWATDAALLHAGSIEALFNTPERLEHPRQGNGYIPMLRAVNEAISAGKTEHWRHDRASTLDVAATLDLVLQTVRGGTD